MIEPVDDVRPLMKRKIPPPSPHPVKLLDDCRPKKMKSYNYPAVHGDKQIITRLRHLILDKSIPPDVNCLYEKLIELYPEYQTKKRQAMKGTVKTALNTLNKVLSDSEEESPTVDKSNTMNNAMSDLYSKGVKLETKVSTPKQEKTPRKVPSDRKQKEDNTQLRERTISKQMEIKEMYHVEPKITLQDLGGMKEVLKQIDQLVFHLTHPEVYLTLGVTPPKGFLVHGPHGVGKTSLVEGIAHAHGLSLFRISSTELVAGVTGESEKRIRELFNLAQFNEPSLLFIDEIDSIAGRRDAATKEMEKRIVTQLVSSMDNLPAAAKVIVVGATSRPDVLDPALRRAGRFDREIGIGIPDEEGRVEILKVLLKGVKISDEIDIPLIARNTPGYVGADIRSLIREAAVSCLDRETQVTDRSSCKDPIPDEILSSLSIKVEDFNIALKVVQPSAKREGFATVPDVKWEDIGALQDVRQELQLSILAPIKFPEDVKSLGLPTSVGLLLCGPPGCGKTLLAKAIANESGLNFISVKGPELLNMYVGESERAVRSVFTRARNSKPCVLFFDEIDALCRKRSDDSSVVASSVVNQLLTEMDGLENRSCILLAATNRPDILDPAILRPGRFDKVVYVGFPSAEERFDIMKTLTKNGTRPPCSPEVDLRIIAFDPRTEGYTGADLLSLVREASTEALKERVLGSISKDQRILVSTVHFENAMKRIVPSISKSEAVKYLKMKDRYGAQIK